MRISMIKAGRVVGFFLRVLMAAFLFLLCARAGETADPRKFTLGYSTVGPAGTGLWMVKEIGAFEKYGIDAELVSVMSLVDRPYYRCGVQPEITRIEDCAGKRSASRAGSVTDNLTRILLRRYKLESAVQIRQMGGTTEMAAAFQRRQIDGAVISALRINAPLRMLADLAELGIRYSNIVIAVSRDYQRRSPDTVEAMVRAYLEGVAAASQQKERALQVIQKYTRLQDPKLIHELYADGIKFLERVPRLDAEALAPIVEFMGRSRYWSRPSLTIASSTAWNERASSTSCTANDSHA